MRSFPFLPVERHSIEDRVRNDQQSRRFQLFSKVVDVKGDNTFIQVYVALFPEDIQGTGSKQFKRQRPELSEA